MEINNGHFSVYIHTNKTNNKMYVGITGRQVEQRWANGQGYKGNNRFWRAIQKYGWDGFDHDIYASNLTEDEAMHMEELLIDRFDLRNPIYGYNIRYGGTNCSLAEETKEKIGNALRGRTYSEEKRKMYSNAHKGKKLSEEHKEAILNSRSKIIRTEQWKENVAKAVHEKCSGDNHWTRRNDGVSKESNEKRSASLKEYYKTHKQTGGNNAKRIMQIENNIVFDSAEVAAKSCFISPSTIRMCATGKRETAGGYHWKYVESLEASRET